MASGWRKQVLFKWHEVGTRLTSCHLLMHPSDFYATGSDLCSYPVDRKVQGRSQDLERCGFSASFIVYDILFRSFAASPENIDENPYFTAIRDIQRIEVYGSRTGVKEIFGITALFVAPRDTEFHFESSVIDALDRAYSFIGSEFDIEG